MLQVADCFSISERGIELFVELVKKRAELDIEFDQANLAAAKRQLKNYSASPPILFPKFRIKQLSEKIDSLSNSITQKEKWIREWEVNQTNLLSCKATQASHSEGISVAERFLSYQEAILIPLFPETSLEVSLISDSQMKDCARRLASIANLPANHVESLFKATTKFCENSLQRRKDMVKYAVIGSLASIAISGLLLGPMAVALGSTMGLGGGAAFTTGLALLGGGALSAGGFGMAGGVAAVVGGGGLIGALSGLGASKLIRHLPPELFTVEVAKMLNFAVFLHAFQKQDDHSQRLASLIQHFLRLKHAVEIAILCEGLTEDEVKLGLRQYESLDRAFRQLTSNRVTADPKLLGFSNGVPRLTTSKLPVSEV